MNLESISLTALRREYHRVFGLDTTSKSKEYIRQRISARRAELAQERAAPRQRDLRVPPVGTVLEREHGGKVHRVKVTDVGFEYKRETYASLSAVAKAITGTQWNGFGFFGLLGANASEESES